MSAPDQVPELVSAALRGTADFYSHSTRHETGRFLATLAASRTGTIAEIGTGGGAGAAWLRSGAPAGTRVLSVEMDPERAELARVTLSSAGVQILTGGTEQLWDRGPFSLLSMDRHTAVEVGRDQSWQLLVPGGVVVIDDFRPSADWPPMTSNGVDWMRQEWLLDGRFESSSVAVAPDVSVLVAVRR